MNVQALLVSICSSLLKEKFYFPQLDTFSDIKELDYFFLNIFFRKMLLAYYEVQMRHIECFLFVLFCTKMLGIVCKLER